MCEILLLIITLTIRYQLNRFFVLLDLYELLINNTLGAGTGMGHVTNN